MEQSSIFYLRRIRELRVAETVDITVVVMVWVTVTKVTEILWVTCELVFRPDSLKVVVVLPRYVSSVIVSPGWLVTVVAVVDWYVAGCGVLAARWLLSVLFVSAWAELIVALGLRLAKTSFESE